MKEVFIMTKELGFAAFVGIDWEHQTHSVYVLPAEGSQQYAEVQQTAQAIAEWVA